MKANSQDGKNNSNQYSSKSSNQEANGKKRSTKKIVKWTSLIIGFVVVAIIIALLTGAVILYNRIFEPIPFVDADSNYSTPSKPSDIIPVESGAEVSDDVPDIDVPESEQVLTEIEKREPINENILNILLIGRDVFGSKGERGRSDSMMMLSYNKETGDISLVSFLRDTLVPFRGDWNRLNATYSYGGVGYTINTINRTYDLDIQYYVSIDYSGFEAVVDELGGVKINITQAESDYFYKNFKQTLATGEQMLDGKTALNYARIRHIKENGSDFGRTNRQRNVIESVIKQIVDESNLSKTLTTVNEGLKYVKTNLEPGMITSLAKEFLSKKNGLINNSFSVPSNGNFDYGTYKGMSILNVDFDKNKAIIKEKIFGN